MAQHPLHDGDGDGVGGNDDDDLIYRKRRSWLLLLVSLRRCDLYVHLMCVCTFVSGPGVQG